VGVVEAIFVTAGGSQPMQRVDAVEAIAGTGLAGDRYAQHTGYWTGVDECQVTLIEAEALDGITASTDVRVTEGQHRRNVVVRGVELRGLAGATFSIGEARLAYDRPRPPCRYIESITEPGMTRALAARRGGICVRVVESGVIRVGDELVVEDVSRVAAWFDRLR
jgi:MOSC domain-containing protein YiiM